MRGAAFYFCPGTVRAPYEAEARDDGLRSVQKTRLQVGAGGFAREVPLVFRSGAAARHPTFSGAYWVVVVPVLFEVPDVDELELELLELDEVSARRTVSEMAVPCFCVPLGEMPVTTAVA